MLSMTERHTEVQSLLSAIGEFAAKRNASQNCTTWPRLTGAFV